jgi:endonuclease-3
VIRLSRRLGLSANSDPVKLEFDLAEITPKKDWSDLSHTLILLGRNVCKAKKPDCENCPINKYCPAAFKPEFW